MKRTREERQTSDRRFVLLGFTSEEGDSSLNDAAVRSAMSEERLRPVTRKEFEALRREVGRPKIPIAAFGNIAHGPSDSGSLPGVPYLDTDGNVEVEENWTRGNTGDQWNGEWKFAFAPAS